MIVFNNLEVEHFRGLESATIEFTPGLNVLYGSNELGKSSLLMAIRAALLLPVTSSEAADYKTWGSQHPPVVRLKFTVEGTLYRVVKSFGKGRQANAALYRMKGAESFKAASSRQVDRELRRLISWGMPEPGTRGTPRGLPQSYLSTALLGQQDEVESILTASIDEDKSESGTKSLTQALGTIGRDPLVVDLLEALNISNARVFSPTGQKRRTADSPLAIKTQAANNAQIQLRELERKLNESNQIEQDLVKLRKSAHDLQQEETRLQHLFDLTARAVAAENVLTQSEKGMAAIQSAERQNQEDQRVLEETQLAYDRARENLEKIQSELQNTESELARARQEAESHERVSTSETAARRNEMAAQKAYIENRIANLETMEKLNNDIQRLNRELEEAREKQATCQQSLNQAQKQHQYTRLLEERHKDELAVQELQQAVEEHRSLQSSVSASETHCDELTALVEQFGVLATLRIQLDSEINNESTLQQSKRMQQEAQRQLETTTQQLEQNNSEIRDLQNSKQNCQQQIASLTGRRQTMLDTKTTSTHSRRELLRNKIATSQQRLQLADSAISVQSDIHEQELIIRDLDNELSRSRRDLDTALTNRTKRDRQHHRSGNKNSQRPDQRISSTQKKLPVVTLAVTAILSIALFATWMIDLLPLGLIAAPLTAIREPVWQSCSGGDNRNAVAHSIHAIAGHHALKEKHPVLAISSTAALMD